MYEQNTAASRKRQAFRSSGNGGRRRAKGNSGHSREDVRFIQLLVCLALFLAVFVGKGVFPDRLLQVRDRLLTALTADTDFRTAFSQLGEALGADGSFGEKLEEVYEQVFAPDREEVDESVSLTAPQLTGLLQEEGRFLSQDPDSQALADHYFQTQGVKPALRLPKEEVAQEEEAAQEETAISQEPAVPAAGTVLAVSDYSGEPLPEHYTMDEISLGDLDTVTPVLGHINSAYGYRDHPINGRYHFHGGVDIGAQQGDPIHSFAAGTVEYTGEDDSYGLYLQVDHGNGVKSFYAHCSRIVVQKGQVVAKGEKLAEVGSTGSATGPHLHLEMKYEQTHLDPIYYIDYLER